jgi:hypothetical protein
MLNLQKLMIDHFVKELRQAYHQTYSSMEPEYENIIAWSGQLALENISRSDALYHNVEHTIQVTLVGQCILRGKHLSEGGVLPKDWLHFTVALLCHDIGYVRGICRDDRDNIVATGVDGQTIEISLDGTDAVLQPYHVDRGKQFVRERFGGKAMLGIGVDAEVITDYIEMTRFPGPDDEKRRDTKSYAGLVRAADFIGQLGDPKYLRKIPALFYEFEETGTNAKNNYKTPGDMRRGYADFYWKGVSRYIQEALRYLRITQEGRLWIANLHAHVFDSEHNKTLL